MQFSADFFRLRFAQFSRTPNAKHIRYVHCNHASRKMETERGALRRSTLFVSLHFGRNPAFACSVRLDAFLGGDFSRAFSNQFLSEKFDIDTKIKMTKPKVACALSILRCNWERHSTEQDLPSAFNVGPPHC